MKILLDEQIPQFFRTVIANLLPNDQVDHVGDLNWKSKKDTVLLADAQQRGYEMFVTNDLRQLEDPDETKAIKRSGLHHLTYHRRGKGLQAQANSLAVLVACLPAVMEYVDQSRDQRLFCAKGIDASHSRRVDVVDPKRNPPRYWR